MNTARTRTRNVLIAALMPLFAAPLASQADVAHTDVAMDACVNAFVASSLEKERPYTVRKQDTATTPLDLQARAYRISLTATGKHSGKKFAKATCIVDRDGVVLSLNGKPYSSAAVARVSKR